jgi:UDP-3-O-[3-hydroxymyristoyl] glucosamine N-acyltransferase
VKLTTLAKTLGATLIAGDGALDIVGVSTLNEAGQEHLSFLTNPKYRDQVDGTGAGAVITGTGVLEGDQLPDGVALLEHETPYLALAQALQVLHPKVTYPAGIHPSAVIADSATIDPSASIGAFAVIGERAVIGATVRLDPGAVISDDAKVGARAFIGAYCVIGRRCVVGEGCELEPHCTIGANGFGYATGPDGKHQRVPQVGNVELAPGVDMGAGCAIDRGAITSTRIGKGTKLGNLCLIAHNVQVGHDCMIVGKVAIAGSATMGNNVVLGGNSDVGGHLHVGDKVQAAAKSGITRSIPDGQVVRGMPARRFEDVTREMRLVGRLEDLYSRVAELESQIERNKD